MTSQGLEHEGSRRDHAAGECCLTVVIPHLNSPHDLEVCLDALAGERQRSLPSMRVIVVDNGSVEPPVALCARYPFVSLTSEREPGPGPARSHGAGLVTSELIGFIDADCYVRPGWAEAVVSYFRNHPQTSVIGGQVLIRRRDPGHPTAVEAYESVFGYRMRLYIERDHYTATCNMAVRRSDFFKVGAFGGIGIAEDVDWGRRASALGLRIDYVPDMAVETPARRDFSDLARKWDRHIAHDLAKVGGGADRLRWMMRAVALAFSPVAEIPRILGAQQLTGFRERLLAWRALTWIRLYRARRMIASLVGAGPSSAAAWRRE